MAVPSESQYYPLLAMFAKNTLWLGPIPNSIAMLLMLYVKDSCKNKTHAGFSLLCMSCHHKVMLDSSTVSV